jgi:hypothetical protein
LCIKRSSEKEIKMEEKVERNEEESEKVKRENKALVLN